VLVWEFIGRNARVSVDKLSVVKRLNETRQTRCFLLDHCADLSQDLLK